jgi:hypothetical protein
MGQTFTCILFTKTVQLTAQIYKSIFRQKFRGLCIISTFCLNFCATNKFHLWYYHGTTFWQILSISFVLPQFSTFLPPECLGLFPKHLIHSLIILLHQNLWMDSYISVKQVLGPPFDKMSHSVTVWHVCKIPSLTTEMESINEVCVDAWVGVWTCLANVTLINAAVSADSNTSIT